MKVILVLIGVVALYIARLLIGALIIWAHVQNIINNGAASFWDIVFILIGLLVVVPYNYGKD